jgi:hypothetical protein
MSNESSTREQANRKNGTTTVIDGELFEHTAYGWRKLKKTRKWVAWLGWISVIIATPCVYVYRRVRQSLSQRPHLR